MSFPLFLRPQLGFCTSRSCLLRLSKPIARRWQSNAPLRRPNAKTPRVELPSTPARTRFAPSPTGYLHLGSLRTALFNYLLAKKTGGQFLLRIDDTDQKRTIPDAEERLLRDLRWAGLQWDEGPEVGGPYGPYKQSNRTELYRDHAEQLLESGHAYRCFCSTERLNALAQQRHKLGLATDYDRTCAHIPTDQSDDRAAGGEKFVVRFRVPDTYPPFEDLIYGPFKPLKVRRADNAFEDPILLKSDGLPTYHLASVVDDHHMKITHVIRGTEWSPSTPKHIALYNAFAWKPPAFAHVGLLVDEHGNKLSKRNFDTDISAFREMEIFPETLTNFAALLGWSHNERSDVMGLQRLVDKFSMKFTKGNTVVTFGKMQFLQRKHAHLRVKERGPGLQELVASVLTVLRDPSGPYKEWEQYTGPDPEEYIEYIIHSDAENYTNANEFVYRNSYLFGPVRSSFVPVGDIPERCKSLAEVQGWTVEELRNKMHEIIYAVMARSGGKEDAKDVYHYVRMKLTDRERGLRLYNVMSMLGREKCLRRLGVDV